MHTSHYEADQKWWCLGSVYTAIIAEGPFSHRDHYLEQGAVCLVLSGPQFAFT